MRNEISSAVGFISDLLAKKVKGTRSEIFRQVLNRVLCTHYQDHWFPEKPFKGSGYRCIRINHKMDPLIARAGSYCGLTEKQLFEILPSELTMWVDPREVSYRIGEEGSIGLIYDGESTPALDNEDEESLVNSNNQNNNQRDQQQQGYHHQQQQQQQQQQQPPQPSDFIQTCKDQLRYLLPDSSDAMNFEYLTTFVAS